MEMEEFQHLRNYNKRERKLMKASANYKNVTFKAGKTAGTAAGMAAERKSWATSAISRRMGLGRRSSGQWIRSWSKEKENYLKSAFCFGELFTQLRESRYFILVW